MSESVGFLSGNSLTHRQSHSSTVPVFIVHRVHDLSDEVDTEPSRANVRQVAGPYRIKVDLLGAILDDELDAVVISGLIDGEPDPAIR